MSCRRMSAADAVRAAERSAKKKLTAVEKKSVTALARATPQFVCDDLGYDLGDLVTRRAQIYLGTGLALVGAAGAAWYFLKR